VPSVASQAISRSPHPETGTRNGPVDRNRPETSFDQLLDDAAPEPVPARPEDPAAPPAGPTAPLAQAGRSDPVSPVRRPSDLAAPASADQPPANLEALATPGRPAKGKASAKDKTAEAVEVPDTSVLVDAASAPSPGISASPNDPFAATASPVAVALPVIVIPAARPPSLLSGDEGPKAEGVTIPGTSGAAPPVPGLQSPGVPTGPVPAIPEEPAALGAPTAAGQPAPGLAAPGQPATPGQPAPTSDPAAPATPGQLATPDDVLSRPPVQELAAAGSTELPPAGTPDGSQGPPVPVPAVSSLPTTPTGTRAAGAGALAQPASSGAPQQQGSVPASGTDETASTVSPTGRPPRIAKSGEPTRPAGKAASEGAAARPADATTPSETKPDDDGAAKAPAATPTAPPGLAKTPEDIEAKGGHPHAVREAMQALGAALGSGDVRPATLATVAAASGGTGPDATQPSNLATSGGLPAPVAGAATAAGNPPANAPYALAAAAPVPISGLAVEIVAQARGGKNDFEIRLDPPELGRIDVHLRVDRDGNVSSHLVVERSDTLDLLRRDAPSLERALENAGLKTGQQGLEFSLRDQAAGQQQGDRNAPAATSLLIPDEAQPVVASSYGRRLGIGGGIDIRV